MLISYRRSKVIKRTLNDKLFHSESYTTVFSSRRAKATQEASVGISKGRNNSQNNAVQHKDYHILEDLWKHCMNSYLTVGMFLGHHSTCSLLNGWNPLIEKKKDMLSTAEWRKNYPTSPK
ncbi:hypothetical protein O181_021835 [Austropuccinia psidii MF-1]|uniref:Uncharacterized protein n=1 Tax=Austropuccinia psidii MF-1 TaxID=1389203 RepID=A0A9Q3CFB6_9BASI|nr:hypothetical protein [Austropuccinia psidii MF-1]